MANTPLTETLAPPVTFAEFCAELNAQGVRPDGSVISNGSQGPSDKITVYAPTDMLYAIAGTASVWYDRPNVPLCQRATTEPLVLPPQWEQDVPAKTLASILLASTGMEAPYWTIPNAAAPETASQPSWLNRMVRRSPEKVTLPEEIPNFPLAKALGKVTTCAYIEQYFSQMIADLHWGVSAIQQPNTTVHTWQNKPAMVGRDQWAVTLRDLTIAKRPVPAGSVVALERQTIRGIRPMSNDEPIRLKRLATVALPPAARPAMPLDDSLTGTARQFLKTGTIQNIRGTVDRSMAQTLKRA